MEKDRFKIVSADGLTPAEMAQAQAHVQRLNNNPPTAPASEETATTESKEAFIREHYMVAQRSMTGYDGLARRTLIKNAKRDGLYSEDTTDEAILADLRHFYNEYEQILNPLMKVRAAAELVLNKRIDATRSGVKLDADFDRQIKNISYRIGHPEITRDQMKDYYAEIGALALAALESLDHE